MVGVGERASAPILRHTQDRLASATRAATPTASALPAGPIFIGHGEPAVTGWCSRRVASCSPPVSRTPHDPQKRFSGGFSYWHRGQHVACSVTVVCSSPRRFIALYTSGYRRRAIAPSFIHHLATPLCHRGPATRLQIHIA